MLKVNDGLTYQRTNGHNELYKQLRCLKSVRIHIERERTELNLVKRLNLPPPLHFSTQNE